MEGIVLLEDKVLGLVDDIYERLLAIRNDFHMHPELGLEEFRTADRIEGYLREWGIDVTGRVNGTSVVGEILGSGSGDVVGLRADIDALPIASKSGADYASVNDGVMHACGHDVHTTILLGAAYVLKQLEDELPGGVKLFFQQAEETVGGAKTMIEAGCLENPEVSYALGLHVCPKLEVGTVGVKYGHAHASSDTITIDVYGREAHAASPQDGVDAILIASHIVMTLQSLISRNISPLESAALSFGVISGGTVHNVVASHVRLCGTLRTLDPSVRKRLKARIFDVADNVAEAFDGEISLTIEPGYDPVINAEDVTRLVQEVATDVLGEAQVVELPDPSLGVEDFAYFAQAVPSSFYRLGVANPDKGIIHPLHDARFDIDVEAIKIGVLIQVQSAIKLMNVSDDATSLKSDDSVTERSRLGKNLWNFNRMKLNTEVAKR